MLTTAIQKHIAKLAGNTKLAEALEMNDKGVVAGPNQVGKTREETVGALPGYWGDTPERAPTGTTEREPRSEALNTAGEKINVEDNHDLLERVFQNMKPQSAADKKLIEQNFTHGKPGSYVARAKTLVELTRGLLPKLPLQGGMFFGNKNLAGDTRMATKNPLEVFEEAKTKEAADKGSKQLQLWQTWKDNGQKPEHLEPLLNMYSSFIDRKATEFGGGLAMINPVALKADLTGHVISAFQNYDPTRGAALATHVYKRVQKSKRFVNKSQNFAYISEGKTGIIGDLQRAQSRLNEDFGRAPTTQELADHMGLSVRKITSVQKSLIKDVPGSSIEGDSGLPRLGQRQAEVLSLLPQVLTPDEHAVFTLAYHPTNPMADTKDIAKKLGIPDWEVSRRKTRILAKMNEFT